VGSWLETPPHLLEKSHLAPKSDKNPLSDTVNRGKS
jgi:hypothetical protein